MSLCPGLTPLPCDRRIANDGLATGWNKTMAAAAGATTTSIVLHPGRRELMLGFISKVRVRDVGISVSWKH